MIKASRTAAPRRRGGAESAEERKTSIHMETTKGSRIGIGNLSPHYYFSAHIARSLHLGGKNTVDVEKLSEIKIASAISLPPKRRGGAVNW